MTSTQENTQLQIPRGSPSSSNSPSQLSTAYLIRNFSNTPSPGRKRVHPNYLKIDDGVPPNKKINTPTKEEKETIMKEKEILYKRLAEEKHAPFYLAPQSIFPILPINNKFTSITPPNIYSFLQHQHAAAVAAASPPRIAPSSSSLSPSSSVDLSHVKQLGPNLAGTSTITTLTSKSPPGSTNLFVGNTAGISGLPTPPGGSSVGTPPRPSYPTQLYPAPFLKFPFSPPTPSSSLGLLSPWNPSNKSLSVNSSVTTPGVPGVEESSPHGGDGTGMLQCLAGSNSNDENANVLATSTPRTDAENVANSGSQKQLDGSVEPHHHYSPSNNLYNLGLMSGATPVRVSAAPILHSNPHPKPPHPYPGFASNLASVRSPLAPFSPAMHHVYSPYAGSMSSCPSVSSSSGCSSASENQDNPVVGVAASLVGGKKYVLSEYHVGPHRFILNEKDNDDQNEDATNSGRNTPVGGATEDSGVSSVPLPGDVVQKFISSDATSKPNAVPSTSGKRRSHSKSSRTKANSPCLYSVESMSSGCQPSTISQGYIVGSHIADRPSSGVSSMSSSLSSRDSTPEPEDLKHDPHQGSDVFCLVPGRLSLLSSTQKYRVTIDEVRRRLSHPECLNASVLGGILRRAKSKNGGTMLRQRLQNIGVSLPPGRRKQTELSLLTSLVESESLHLASDFNRVCESFFPHGELAQIIARQHTGTPEAQHRVSMVKATQLIVSELQAMLDAVGGPSNIRPNNPNNPYPGLTNFSLLTHGFGNPAIATSLGVLQTYLQELLAYYECRKPIQTAENRYTFGGDNVTQTSSASSSSTQSLGMGSGLGPESVSMHGNLPQQHHHPLQNPLLYATRHFPAQVGSQEMVSSSHAGETAVEVSLKEEPVESPSNYAN